MKISKHFTPFILAMLVTFCTPLEAPAANRITDEIMNDAFLLGRAAVCVPSTNSEKFGRAMGTSVAEYYVKKAPRLDGSEVMSALMAGFGLGTGEQQRKGMAECSQVINAANGVLKKVGARVRF